LPLNWQFKTVVALLKKRKLPLKQKKFIKRYQFLNDITLNTLQLGHGA